MKKYIVFLLLLIALSSQAFAASAVPSADPPILSVEGQGESAVLPDMAAISVGVMSENENAASAQNENAKRTKEVLAAMENLGIQRKDLATSDYTFYPTTASDENDRSTRISYVVRNSVTVTVHDLNAVGGVIDAALANGANEIHSLEFLSRDTSKARDQAMLHAVKDAREKANTIAKDVGMHVIGIKSISESTNGAISRPLTGDLAMASKHAATPIEAGNLTVTATVRIDFILGA